jgi:hypothetical protein
MAMRGPARRGLAGRGRGNTALILGHGKARLGEALPGAAVLGAAGRGMGSHNVRMWDYNDATWHGLA